MLLLLVLWGRSSYAGSAGVCCWYVRDALICSSSDLEAELSHTLLWRENVERHVARRVEDGLLLALAARPHIVLVDRDLPGAERLVSGLRSDPSTRRSSIVVVARDDFDPAEVELLEAGANAILRLPAGPEWDERLDRLLNVPTRREARLAVQYEVTAERDGKLSKVVARMLNLSAHGMLLDSPVPLSVGDDLDFGFRLPGSELPITGCGRVVRQAGGQRYGVEFYGLEADGNERVRYFVETGGLQSSGPGSADGL